MSKAFNDYLSDLTAKRRTIERREIEEDQIINYAFHLGRLDGEAYVDFILDRLTDDEYTVIRRRIFDLKLELNMMR
ncbi:MAG: hypothetical protein IK999_10620 [Ruminococcus sp.]|nr:hypothetical protein [Ruminococcus sp.]